jgi:endoglucanase
MSRAAHGLASLTLVVATASCGAPKPAEKTVVLGGPRKALPAAPAMPGVNVPAIKVDTVGYPTTWKKVAIWNVEPKDAVVKDEAGKVVLKLTADKIVAKGVDESSKDPVWQVDFSDLKTPGTYVLESAGAKSDPFKIGDDVHQVALLAGLKSFYFQRTRTALEKPFAVWEGDEYLRKKPSHVHDDVGWDLLDHPEKKRKWKVEAGWHDAGNFDMYVPSTAPSAQTLLYAYEWSPDAFDDKAVVIPESGNRIPDVLDEARWGLRWVLSMQEDNGAFRHREAVMETSPELPADEDMTVRWIAGISTAGTAKAVAATAVCARVYEPFDAAFARRCAEASKKGWAWLKANPKRVITDGKGSIQPLWDDEPGNTDTGAQFVAAVEYWRTFRDPAALEKAKSLLGEKELQPAEFAKGAWANVSRWGLFTLATDAKTPPALKAEAKNRVLAAADTMRARAESADGYLCVQTPEDYYWASASNLMEKTHLLAVAARLSGDERYLQAARDQWHWVLGRNPNGYSMTTRVGKGPTRFYHMEWGHREPPPPGFLLGGPNGQSMPFLAPGAPAKALLWDNPKPLRSGAPAHAMWHWQQTDLWDSGFIPEDSWNLGWWTVSEPDIIYSANFVLAAVAVR